MSIEYYNLCKQLPYVPVNAENTILYNENENKRREAFTENDISKLTEELNTYNSLKMDTTSSKYNLGDTYAQKGSVNYDPTLVDQKEIDVNLSQQQYNHLFSASIVSVLTLGTIIGMIVMAKNSG